MEKNPTWLPVVALALSDGKGRWLMHRRPPGKAHEGLWEFPGGKVEADETPANALVREIEEELAYRLEPADLQPACFAQERGRRPIVILLYTATWNGAALTPAEGGSIGWYTPAQIQPLPKPPLDISLARGLFEKVTV